MSRSFLGPRAFPRMHREIPSGRVPWDLRCSQWGLHPAPQPPGSVGSWLGGPRKTLPPLLAVHRDTLCSRWVHCRGKAVFVPCLCPTEHHSTMEEAVAGAVILLGTAFLPSTAAISVLRRSTGAGRALSPGADGWPQAQQLGSAVGRQVPVSGIQDIFKDSGRKTDSRVSAGETWPSKQQRSWNVPGLERGVQGATVLPTGRVPSPRGTLEGTLMAPRPEPHCDAGDGAQTRRCFPGCGGWALWQWQLCCMDVLDIAVFLPENPHPGGVRCLTCHQPWEKRESKGTSKRHGRTQWGHATSDPPLPMAPMSHGGPAGPWGPGGGHACQ